MKSQKRVLLTVVGVLAIAVIALVYWKNFGKKHTVREVAGVITFIDHDARRASMEMADPNGGAVMEITGVVPENCVITVDGKSAEFDDVQVRDRVQVRGRISEERNDRGEWSKQLVAEAIAISRT